MYILLRRKISRNSLEKEIDGNNRRYANANAILILLVFRFGALRSVLAFYQCSLNRPGSILFKINFVCDAKQTFDVYLTVVLPPLKKLLLDFC